MLSNMPTADVLRYYVWLYAQKRDRARRRAHELSQAHNNTPKSCTKRRERLRDAAALACADASAADYMLRLVQGDNRPCDAEHDFRRWLLDRCARFDWRGAFVDAKAQALLDMGA